MRCSELGVRGGALLLLVEGGSGWCCGVVPLGELPLVAVAAAAAALLLLLLLLLLVLLPPPPPLRRLDMLMDLGSCRGEVDGCVLGGLRGSCGAGGRPLGIIDGEE
jgi:hypothetical protein